MTIDDLGLYEFDALPEGSASQERDAPWFLGAAPAPRGEPTDDAGRAAMAEELESIPFFGAVDALIGFVGEGRRLTARGELFAGDRKEFERSRSNEQSRLSWSAYGGDPLTQVAWDALLRDGWLVREERWVRPADDARRFPRQGAPVENRLGAARRLLIGLLDALMDTDTPRDWYLPRRTGREDVLNALLIASGPRG